MIATVIKASLSAKPNLYDKNVKQIMHIRTKLTSAIADARNFEKTKRYIEASVLWDIVHELDNVLRREIEKTEDLDFAMNQFCEEFPSALECRCYDV